MGFSLLLYIILSCSVGIFFIGASLDVVDMSDLSFYLHEFSQTSYSLHSPRWIVLLSGVLIILFCFRYLQTGLRRLSRDKSIRFESSQGTVSITLFAIEDMLKKMLEEKTEVSQIRPKVSLKKKGIEILIKGVLSAEVNLVEFTQEIQEKIKEKMDTFLGEDKDVRVNLEIRKVSMPGKKGSLPSQEPEVPFRHYD